MLSTQHWVSVWEVVSNMVSLFWDHVSAKFQQTGMWTEGYVDSVKVVMCGTSMDPSFSKKPKLCTKLLKLSGRVLFNMSHKSQK